MIQWVVPTPRSGTGGEWRSEKEVRLGSCRDKQEGICMSGLGFSGRGSEVTSPRAKLPTGSRPSSHCYGELLAGCEWIGIGVGKLCPADQI